MPLRPCLSCGTPSPETYCARCAPRRPAGSTTDRGYGSDHQHQRAVLEPIVATGTVRCARGAACLYAVTVAGRTIGGLIPAGAPWDVGHADQQSAGGPEHRRCNRAAGAARGNRGRRRS